MISTTAERNVQLIKSYTSKFSPVLENFAQLAAIPRPSGHEEKVCTYLKGLAIERGFPWFEDKVGNICIKVPSVGCSSTTKPVIIQGHVDIVAEKTPESTHDFFNHGIDLKIENGWLKSAKGTTLGSDNGVGVAAALALLNENTQINSRRPPLELLFTLDEERGLKGALGLDAKALQLEGRTLLNLDTEEWESVYIGCAGGGDSRFRIPLVRSNNVNYQDCHFYQLSISHATGGHSGIDIDKNRCNAIELLAELSSLLLHEGLVSGLVSIRGGDKRNAIPREATAILTLMPNQSQSSLFQAVQALNEESKQKYSATDPNLKVEIAPAADDIGAPLEDVSTKSILSLLVQSGLKRGALKMSESITDLVETSSNLASVTMKFDEKSEFFEICCSTRSSVASQIEDVRADLARAVTSVHGIVIEQPPAYTGWQPNMNSRVLNLVKQCFQAQNNGKQPEVKAIHAGLECGMLIAKIAPDLDCISFGPTIVDAHTPDERLDLITVDPFFALLLNLLDALCDEE